MCSEKGVEVFRAHVLEGIARFYFCFHGAAFSFSQRTSEKEIAGKGALFSAKQWAHLFRYFAACISFVHT